MVNFMYDSSHGWLFAKRNDRYNNFQNNRKSIIFCFSYFLFSISIPAIVENISRSIAASEKILNGLLMCGLIVKIGSLLELVGMVITADCEEVFGNVAKVLKFGRMGQSMKDTGMMEKCKEKVEKRKYQKLTENIAGFNSAGDLEKRHAKQDS